ncbi:MAG TPA: hypothetical protein VKG24_08045, partial [Pseudolabrys sp.]|nr:hypothetical protein [Pseudolabrys sp.]
MVTMVFSDGPPGPLKNKNPRALPEGFIAAKTKCFSWRASASSAKQADARFQFLDPRKNREAFLQVLHCFILRFLVPDQKPST